MKKRTYFIISLIYILILNGCTYTGRNDLGLFINNFNSVCTENLQIKEENLVLHTDKASDEKAKENTYYIFYPADNEAEYMVILNENADSDIYKCGICIISSIDVDPEIIKNIFTAEAFALKNISETSADKIFDDLGLNKTETYSKTDSITKETDQCTVELVVNSAGTGIYIY